MLYATRYRFRPNDKSQSCAEIDVWDSRIMCRACGIVWSICFVLCPEYAQWSHLQFQSLVPSYVDWIVRVHYENIVQSLTSDRALTCIIAVHVSNFVAFQVHLASACHCPCFSLNLEIVPTGIHETIGTFCMMMCIISKRNLNALFFCYFSDNDRNCLCVLSLCTLGNKSTFVVCGAPLAMHELSKTVCSIAWVCINGH